MGYRGFTEYSRLWDNKNLQELQVMGKIKEWESCGISRLTHIYEDRTLKSFQDLREEYDILNQSFSKYLQIRHALGAKMQALK